MKRHKSKLLFKIELLIIIIIIILNLMHRREEEGLLHPLELSKKALPRGKDQDKKTYVK